jgi:hypothetical protein
MGLQQNWYFVFGENSVFKKRYIKFFGTREECVRNLIFWHLGGLVNLVLPERDFLKSGYLDDGYKEIEVEGA